MNSSLVRYLFFYIFILCSSTVVSQNESAIWYFGEYAGLDFNSGNPVPLTNGQLNTKEGCATISDANGSLLFYTDGKTVWDRQHNVMPNGTGLLGDASSSESAIIIPKPGETSIYYLFTVDKPSYFLTEDDPISGLNYSKVDMTLNNGMGDVVADEKNIHLITYDTNDSEQNEYKCSEKITAVTHSNGSSIWVITQFMDKFFAFHVDFNGVNPNPVVSTIPLTVFPRINEDGQNISAIGYLKVSPNGKKIAIAHSSTTLGSPVSGRKRSGKVLLYDFNNSNGMVSNQRSLINDEYPYGLEFSPNSKLLYATSSIFDANDDFVNSFLYQYDTEASNVEQSEIIISNSQNVAGALQLAIDGKIYRAGYPVFGSGSHLSVINNPNEAGNGCNYSQNTVFLNNRVANLGLPPFIQSIFNYTFDFEFTCFGDNTHFFITSEDPYDNLVWDFGDGTTSNQEDTYHMYVNPGIYYVSLTLSLNGVEYDPFIKQIIISEPPEVLQDIYDLVQCDSFDDNPNDGITTFNLEDANGPISLFSSDTIRVHYYHSEEEAVSDEDNTNGLNYVYTNAQSEELLYAKVSAANTNCYSIATIRLITSPAVNIETYNLSACDYQNSGWANFDLDSVRNQLIADINLPELNITFHFNENDAAIGINPVDNDYDSQTSELFIRIENDNACYGSGILQLDVVSFPTIENQTIDICQSDFPIEIGSGIASQLMNDYNYLWSNNETSEHITIFEAGEYQVDVIDPIYQCEKTITINVREYQQAEIQEIVLNDLNVTVVLNNGIENFQFSLDNPQGEFQNSNLFANVEPGLHTIYVKDIFNCTMVSIDFGLIGFPKFFTPNNDGINDFWNIKGLKPSDYPNINIKVFDRYGKLIKNFNPHTTDGWDGTFNGHLLTPDDYWYYLKLPDGKEYRGHFSLKV